MVLSCIYGNSYLTIVFDEKLQPKHFIDAYSFFKYENSLEKTSFLHKLALKIIGM